MVSHVSAPLTSDATLHYANKNNAGKSRWDERSKTILLKKTRHVNLVDDIPRSCTSSSNKAIPDLLYFIYGSVVELTEGAWKQYSQFLYNIKPEFVNSEFFSAIKRKEGYLHNLPSKKRLHMQQKTPMSLQELIPSAQKWWPSWDPRKHIDSTIEADMTEIPQTCERLERRLKESHGVPSVHDQNFILQQCKQMNLIWVGKNKLSGLGPDQVEQVLGYPVNHTNLADIDLSRRFNIMKLSFQTDTIGYLLSPLKALYPNGLRVLSVYTGIGGAEVALDHLGLHLKCVVSVEASEVNRKILKRYLP